jgi:hypothetical protein
MEGFHYDPHKDCSQNASVTIGKMDMVYGYRQAKKFKSESPGICCKSGKVKLWQLEPPPQERLTYTSGDVRVEEFSW